MSCGEFMAGPWECQLKEELETFSTKRELDEKFGGGLGNGFAGRCVSNNGRV
jgi:hypothetical protein